MDTTTDLNKNALYASLGVPEFWRFNGQALRILQLRNGAYTEIENSPTFPLLRKADFYQFLETAFQDEVSAEINLRQWVRQHVAG